MKTLLTQLGAQSIKTKFLDLIKESSRKSYDSKLFGKKKLRLL
jgi:hypothetical protein